MEKKQWIGFLLILLIFSTIFIKPILLRIEYKETVAVILYTRYSGSVETYSYYAKYKYNIKGKIYYNTGSHPPKEIKRGVKIIVRYSPLFPSISSARFKEIVKNDTTIYLGDD